VIIRGIATDVKDSTLKLAALNALIAKHEKTDDFSPVTADMSSYKACKVIEIMPESITAKSDFSQNQPDENRRAIAEYLFKRNQPGDRQAVQAMGFNFK